MKFIITPITLTLVLFYTLFAGATGTETLNDFVLKRNKTVAKITDYKFPQFYS